jgi:hypothetical protein
MFDRREPRPSENAEAQLTVAQVQIFTLSALLFGERHPRPRSKDAG